MSSTARTVPDGSAHALLKALGWAGAAAALDDLLQRAITRRLGPAQFLELLAGAERQERARRSLDRRTRRARIGPFKPAADFDWNWPESIDRALVERALELRFFDAGDNVILCGSHGLGKTMLVKNIAYNALLAGHSVVTVTAQRLLGDLASIDSPSRLKKALGYHGGVALLCVDELGYLAYNERAADLLFDIVSRRYEARRPIVISTNLAFREWGQVFPNAICTAALIERLVHRADIINIAGRSWRMREAEARLAASAAEVTP